MNENKKFLKGLLIGFSGSLIVLSIVFASLYFKVEFVWPNGSSSNANTGKSNGINETDATDNDEILKKVQKIEAYIEKYYLEEVDVQDYADGIYKGLVDSIGDRYSTYYNKEEYESMMIASSGTYYGIGVSVSQNVTTGIITVVKPFVTGPGYEAGILPGDIIYKVSGEEVTGLDISEVVSRIKGEDKTKVEISIVREGESEPIDLVVERRKIEVPTVEYEMLDNKIGYIQIVEFDEVTLSQFKKAVDDLDNQGQEGLIIDLRDNPGGLLDVVVNMLDYLLPKNAGMIVYTEDKYGNREEYKTKDKHQFDKPLAVLINGNSASASEIFAGAIKDYEIGTLIGKKSFGKGIVQRIVSLGDGTALKLTISKYYTPKGNNIHGIGIEPDIEIDLTDEVRKQVIIEKADDAQLQKALEVINEKLER